VYVVKVTLLDTSPPVWRRILVPRDITLQHLHRTLQTVMGWTNSHLHQFVVQRRTSFDPRSRGETKVTNENRTRLGELLWTVGASLLYEYDFGDGWRHQLLLEEVLTGDESFQQICVAGKRCCPPEDCGGPQGFAELLNALRDAMTTTTTEAVPSKPTHTDFRTVIAMGTARVSTKDGKMTLGTSM
jgi:Plasmid pRiA4b ORF-3-like protein